MKIMGNYYRANLRSCISEIFFASIYLHPVTSSTLYDPLELVLIVDSIRVMINNWAQKSD